LLLFALLQQPAHAVPVVPASDHVVIERLPVQLKPPERSSDPRQTAARAKALIEKAREQGDPRFLGYAQTLLSPWWDKPDAPADIAVLQATILQSEHRFDDARKVLQRVAAAHPSHVQALLTLATIERVTGYLAASDTACAALSRASARWVAGMCAAENQSLRGGFEPARQALAALASAPGVSAPQIAWAQSLAAENEERAGNDSAAAQLYRAALQTAPDRYTTLAYADLLLRTGKAAQAVQVLAQEPATDAVLLRRAAAAKRLNDPQWRSISAELGARQAQLAVRDDSAAHAREAALRALWIEGNTQQAWREARRNYTLQREAADGLLLLQAAQATRSPENIRTARGLLRATGFVDARLALVDSSL
jgi:hypothetical protein